MDSVLNLGSLAEVIQGFSGRVLDYALVLAAVGTITMALVELLKVVTRGRLIFHWWMVGRWIGWNESVKIELLTLAVGDLKSASALYDQPSEKMLGQIQAAANVALDFPTVYPSFYEFLTAGSARVENLADHERWRRFAPRMAKGVPAEATLKAEFEAESRESTQARARLGNLVTRKLDAFQTKVEYRWARLNQIVAVVGGAAFLYYVLPVAVNARPVPVFTRLLAALIGGLVAPFAKDVVNALTGLRARR